MYDVKLPKSVLRVFAGFLVMSTVGCAGLSGGIAPGSAEIGRFPLPQNGVAIVYRDPAADRYRLMLAAQRTAVVPVRDLDGVRDVRLVGSATLDGESVALFEGAGPGCPARNLLVMAGGAQNRSIVLPGCDRHFDISVQNGPRAAVVLRSPVRPVTYFVYSDGNLRGPAVETAPAKRPVAPRPRPQGPAAPAPRVDPSPPAAAPLDLDSVPPAAGPAPLDLDK